MASLNKFSFYRWWARARGLFWRGCLAWAIGALFLMNDDSSTFDTRFQMRGAQPASSKIVVIKFKPSDLAGFYRQRVQSIPPVQEVADITDSYYWDPLLWEQLLKSILPQNPTAVGIALFFGGNLGPVKLSPEQKNIFSDRRVYWGAANNERSGNSMFALYNKSNVGLLELLRDDDGVIRRFVTTKVEGKIEGMHMTEKLAHQVQSRKNSLYINYRGDSTTFFEYSISDILAGNYSPKAFKDKIIIIGSESTSTAQYLTPLGPSNRPQVLGQIVDNILNNRWINKAPLVIYLTALFVLMLMGVLIVTAYPQAVAFTLLFWLGTLITALSVWVFDTFYLWIPVSSAWVTIAATWVIFLGYQANRIERKHWHLKQEQKYLHELEQLKNNFVSLISHDLKTPIAKIQAIVDRLLIEKNEDSSLIEDLKSLRTSSEELNKYIQSILKVLRVESRDFKLHLDVGDINEVVEEAIQQLKPLATEKDIEIKADLEPLFSMEADFTLIREVLINLIENAIKYTPSSGRINVKSREVNNFVHIDVVDTGEGIAEEEINHVWKKFTRGKDQDLKTKGTGLGLYLVKFFIELHGGKVWIESEINKGTQVSFSLPLEDNQEMTIT
jgi:two-component system phosphate regulon sensor histidine kinase PhoR